MNKYQRGILVGAGIAIAAYQAYGISEDGLSESRGWAVSFLIAAILLFVGSGDWSGLISRFRNTSPGQVNQQKPSPANGVSSPSPSQPTPRPQEQPAPKGKHAYGLHISELDLAIESAKGYAEKTNMFHPLQGNGKALHWNSCKLIYAAMRVAARKGKMNISAMVWNTITRAMVVRMTTEGDDAIPMGSTGFKILESEAYGELKALDGAVEAVLAGKGAYELEPVVTLLATSFGARGESVKALSAAVLIYANEAHSKIVPELLEDLS